jgi:hypothetical protein
MGSAAYLRVDAVFRRWFQDAFGPVFRELAVHFEECVDVLDEVRTSAGGDAPEVVVRLYEQWLEKGDEQTEERLRNLGVILPGHGDS